tara:strand:- start:4078 stop:4512 length:435 start_codon:yes stop_codon:yes gene_type:complete
MNRTTITSMMASGLVVSIVALSAAGGALAQSAGTGGNGGNGGHGGTGGIGSTSGEGGSGRVIVCTGCADPNAFIEDGVLKGGGHGGGAAAPVVAHVPRAPHSPNRRPKPRTYRANEACHLKQDLLPDGRMVIYRDCGEVIRGYR